MEELHHVPVLVEEVVSTLVSEKTEIFVDATLGLGGHSEEILKRYEWVRVIGVDVDEEEIKIANERLKQFGKRLTIVKGNYRDLDKIVTRLGLGLVDAVLFDLGISSYHLNSKRGFSFLEDEFLDMRMDKSQRLTAYDVVNKYPFKRLKEIIRTYGEEREAFRLADAIVRSRKLKEIKTAKELAEIVGKAKKRRTRLHPATLTFQAIRIEVNREIDNLKEGLKKATDVLRKGGRIGVISFHSIEDRVVKEFVKKEGSLIPITKKPIIPSKEEILKNPRSRSAKLRVAEKV
jgi:16S rRNA (cytosine1402-N4)-methyltransferase